jgi:hypothetical protein
VKHRETLILKLNKERDGDMQTLEPDIQEKIITMLPEDGELAILVLAQLFANVVMSVNGMNINAAVDMIMVNWKSYERSPL